MKSKYKRIFELMLNENKFLSLVWIVFSVGIGVLPAASIIINKNLVNSLEKIKTVDHDKIISLLVLMFLLAVTREIIKNLNIYIYTRIKYNISFKMEKHLYNSILNCQMEQFEDNNMYNSILMASKALEMNSLDIIVLFIGSVSNGITLITIMVTLISINWRLPIILVVASIPSTLGIVFVKKYKYKVRESLLELTRKNNYYASLFTEKRGIRDIKLFELKKYFMSIWSEQKQLIINKIKKIVVREGIINVLGQVLINISILFATLYLVNMVVNGNIDLGSFVSLLTAVTLFQSTLTIISENNANIYEMSLYIDALFRVLDRESKQEDNEESAEKNESKISLEDTNIDSIELKNVSFKYRQAKNITVKDITLKINKGDKVAVVGYNGSGKTTLINLLLGLYNPDQGGLFINDIEKDKYNINSYYSKIACIPQDFMKYDFSLFENIALNKEDNKENREKVISILSKLNFDKNKIKRIDDILSAKYSGGFELSGGEWQKIAIARSVIRDAEIVIFDEPTSSLDPIAEVNIYNDLNTISKDKTSIVISHRLGITKFCNKIIVMKEGKIVEMGNHEQLMQLKGEYAYLYKAQSAWYDIQ